MKARPQTVREAIAMALKKIEKDKVENPTIQMILILGLIRDAVVWIVMTSELTDDMNIEMKLIEIFEKIFN